MRFVHDDDDDYILETHTDNGPPEVCLWRTVT